MSFLTILVSSLVALGASSQPASKPTTTRSSGDPAVDAVLDRLEQRGDKLHSLTSRLRADFVDVVAQDEQSKIGRIWFRRDKPNPKFKVVYDKTLFDGFETDDRHEYAFDGQTLTELHHKSRTGRERPIVREGEKVDPFRIGKGPFPLPFGQKKADILEHFVVTPVRRSAKDPPRTDHLKLIPRKGSDMAEQYLELHFYISKKIDLPIRIVAHQRRPGSKEVDEIVTVNFLDLKVNPEVTDGALAVPRPKGKDWSFTREPLPDG